MLEEGPVLSRAARGFCVVGGPAIPNSSRRAVDHAAQISHRNLELRTRASAADRGWAESSVGSAGQSALRLSPVPLGSGLTRRGRSRPVLRCRTEPSSGVWCPVRPDRGVHDSDTGTRRRLSRWPRRRVGTAPTAGSWRGRLYRAGMAVSLVATRMRGTNRCHPTMSWVHPRFRRWRTGRGRVGPAAGAQVRPVFVPSPPVVLDVVANLARVFLRREAHRYRGAHLGPSGPPACPDELVVGGG